MNWENDGYEIKNFKDDKGKVRSRPQNLQYYFKPAITWSDVTSGSFSGRYAEQGFMFDIKGSSGFPDKELLPYVLGLLNSKVAQAFIKILNPTMTTQVGDMTRIPVIKADIDEITLLSKECIDEAKADWNSFETSWDFKIHPLIRCGGKQNSYIKDAFENWVYECEQRFRNIKNNEEKLNQKFIEIYGWTGEISSEVNEKYITVSKADLNRDIRSFISYAVGCMFGRYSLNVDGLAYAGGEWDNSKYVSFAVDKDNIIPICDDEYFEDDIVGLFVEFVKTVYGVDTLDENLKFIADALGSKGQPKEIIRNYFLNDFYADHCSRYSVTGSGKRPIYWLFDSGKKNGFKALIYMHRYDADTVGRVRIDYLHRAQKYIETAMQSAQYVMWDCVAFDEVAGIKFKDKDGIQIMKGYMASGAFSRGKAEIQAKASMVFVGNINQSVDTLLKTSSLFDPFPPEMGTDTAFLDRMHCYIPGWEIPKYRPDSFTNDYGFITDYLSEFMRELRKDSYSDLMDKYFRLGNNLNQRDTIAVRKMISGFTKLLYPDGEVTKEELREIVEISLELRRRVKEQLKKIGGMEFYDVNFSYTDNDSFEEHYVSVPEQGGGKLIPEGMGKPGSVYTVSKSKTGMIGCYMLETQMMPGNGKLTCTGIGSGKEPKEATNTAFNYLKANGNRISGQISTTTKDYIINYQDMQGIGMTGNLALPTLIAICSAALGKTPLNSLAILGEISIGGTLIKVDELASTLQVCLDSGAKKVLLPITSAGDLGTVPSDLVGAFSLIFYSSAEEAVFKALGVE